MCCFITDNGYSITADGVLAMVWSKARQWTHAGNERSPGPWRIPISPRSTFDLRLAPSLKCCVLAWRLCAVVRLLSSLTNSAILEYLKPKTSDCWCFFPLFLTTHQIPASVKLHTLNVYKMCFLRCDNAFSSQFLCKINILQHYKLLITSSGISSSPTYICHISWSFTISNLTKSTLMSGLQEKTNLRSVFLTYVLVSFT